MHEFSRKTIAYRDFLDPVGRLDKDSTFAE